MLQGRCTEKQTQRKERVKLYVVGRPMQKYIFVIIRDPVCVRVYVRARVRACVCVCVCVGLTGPDEPIFILARGRTEVKERRQG